MRALVCTEYGDAAGLSLGELPEPQVQDDSVLIDVKCAGGVCRCTHGSQQTAK